MKIVLNGFVELVDNFIDEKSLSKILKTMSRPTKGLT
jgi:hypothetical protein